MDPKGLYTIGHSTLAVVAFLARLHSAGVLGLADIRRFPASRRNPQFNRVALEASLADQGVEYRWFEALGGRRPASHDAGESPNAGLRVGGFRAYADYALTEPFRAGLDELLAWAAERPVAVCCAEALWWQCHRRIVADHLAARGHAVLHIMGEGKLEPHTLWSLARLTPLGPVYPPEQPELFGARG